MSCSLVYPAFARAQVSELSSLEGNVEIFMNLIPRDGTTSDMQPLCKKLFLEISSEFVFGKSANSLEPEKSSTVDHRLVQVFQRYMLGRFKFLLGEKSGLLNARKYRASLMSLLIKNLKTKLLQ